MDGMSKDGESGGERGRGNEGFNQLARVIQSRIQDLQPKNLVLDFGEINGDYSLQTNTFPATIPVGMYQVCRTLTYGKLGAWLADTQEKSGAHEGHTSGDGRHEHPVLIPPKMQSLKPGDRVLVAWVGNDAVVIDLVLPAANAM